MLIGLLLVSLVMAGCGGGTGEDANSITLAGSTSVSPVAEVLAEEYMNLNKDVQIHVQSSGSSAGIKAAQEESANIGMASRNLKPDELGIDEIVIARDGIVMIVNNENTAVSNLTVEQIRKIYTGELSNWSDVGGENAEIIVVTRETGSGTRGAFEDIVMEGEE